MPTRSASLTLTPPKGWPQIVRSAMLHAISMAATALTVAWGRAGATRCSRQR